jgi:hypothetical protein
MMSAEKGWIVLDDMGDNLTWEGDAWTKNKNLVRHCLAQGYKVIVSDVGFCKDECRADFQRAFPAVQWVFFENDPAACIENVRRRCGTEWRSHSLEAEMASIQQLSLNYHPTAERIPCYRPQAGCS